MGRCFGFALNINVKVMSDGGKSDREMELLSMRR